MNKEEYIKKAEEILGNKHDIERDFISDYSWYNDVVEALYQLHLEGVREEREALRIQIDSIVNAHLWGDYGLSTTEVYEGMRKFLHELEQRERLKK